MNICIFVGARPNFIKVAPLIRTIGKARENGRDVKCELVFAGESGDDTLEPTLFDALQIPRPDVCLGVTCNNLNELTGQVMAHFEHYLQQHPADVVVVVDDLASTMAAAIVTKKQGITLAHIAAGTRSFDISMPKEINRLVIDGLSDLLFTAGISNNSIANKEGAELSKVYMVGNILIDNIRANQAMFRKPEVLTNKGIGDRQYIVFTLNRKALMADEANLKAMLRAMMEAADGTPVIAPLRQSALQAVIGTDECDSPTFIATEPMPYLEFSYLIAHAKGIVTDSGNVAEEATFDNVPCITLNSYTEHIETVKQGSNILVGEDPEKLSEAVGRMVANDWKQCSIPDRWDGRTAERILQILLEQHR